MGNIEERGASGQPEIEARFAAVTRELYTLAQQGQLSGEIDCVPVQMDGVVDPVAFLLQFDDAAISVGADGSMFFVNGDGPDQQYFSIAPDLNNLVMAADIMRRSSVQ